MASFGLIGSFINLIHKQIEIYSKMLNLSLEKKEVIVKNDVESLRKITGEENILIGRSQRLEKERLELVKDISSVLNVKYQDVTISYLVDILKGQSESERNDLVKAASDLRELLKRVKTVNEQNKLLIQNSLEYIDFSINVIKSAVGDEPSFSSPYGESLSMNKGFVDFKQ